MRACASDSNAAEPRPQTAGIARSPRAMTKEVRMSLRRISAAVAVVGVGLAVAGTQAASGAGAAAASKSVSMSEFKFKPNAITVKAGSLRVTARNTGKFPHEFVLIKTNRTAGRLPGKNNRASEAGSVGEITELGKGRRGTHNFHLKRGHNVFICNVPGHYKSGMYGTLTVK